MSYLTSYIIFEHFTIHIPTGKDWDGLAEVIATKTSSQIRNFYQNYKSRLGACIISCMYLCMSDLYCMHVHKSVCVQMT